MADVTVILPSTDEGEMLRASLPAALAQRGAAVDVHVIQNASRDSTDEVIAANPAARVTRLEERASYARLHNLALAQPTADAVLFLNADCFLEPGFCAAALEPLEGEGVGAVQGKLLRAAGPDPGQRLAEIDSLGIVLDRRHRNSIAAHGAPADSHSMPGPIFGPDGAAALYRRAALDDISLEGEVVDETLELYGTDADIAWRLRLQGWRAVYQPTAVAYHVRTYSPSTRHQVPPASRRQQFRNRYLMMLKNDSASNLARHLPWILSFEAMALGWALLRERFLLGAYREALVHAPEMRRRRRAAAGRRTARPRELAPFFARLGPTP